MSAFAVREELVKKLVNDPIWNKRLESCKSIQEVQDPMEAYVKEKGLKVVKVKTS